MSDRERELEAALKELLDLIFPGDRPTDWPFVKLWKWADAKKIILMVRKAKQLAGVSAGA